jgi:hypothetical protein
MLSISAVAEEMKSGIKIKIRKMIKSTIPIKRKTSRLSESTGSADPALTLDLALNHILNPNRHRNLNPP